MRESFVTALRHLNRVPAEERALVDADERKRWTAVT